MTDLTQAIAEVQIFATEYPYEAGDALSWFDATVLNAVASGELIPLADHKLAVAMVVEKAAQSGYVACAETRHVSLGNKVRDTICALIPDDALAEVQALRARIVSTLKDRTLILEERDRTFALMLARAEAAEAELAATQAKLARMVEALAFYADVQDYLTPFTGGMGKLWMDCGQTARAAIKGAKP